MTSETRLYPFPSKYSTTIVCGPAVNVLVTSGCGVG